MIDAKTVLTDIYNEAPQTLQQWFRANADSVIRATNSAVEEYNRKQKTTGPKSKRASTKLKVEWVHVGRNTWMGIANPGPNEYALMAAVNKETIHSWSRIEKPYRVIETIPYPYYGGDPRITALNRRPHHHVLSTHATLEEARAAAVEHEHSADAAEQRQHDAEKTARAAEERRQQEERMRDAERQRREKETQEAEDRLNKAKDRLDPKNNPWASPHDPLIWSETPTKHVVAYHATNGQGKPLFAFFWRQHGSSMFHIRVLSDKLYGGRMIDSANDINTAKQKAISNGFACLGLYAIREKDWPPHPQPRWQHIRDEVEEYFESEYQKKRRYHEERQRHEERTRYSAPPPPPPSDYRSLKRWKDLSRVADPTNNAAENERKMAQRLMDKIKQEWEQASESGREALRSKYHRNPYWFKIQRKK